MVRSWMMVGGGDGGGAAMVVVKQAVVAAGAAEMGKVVVTVMAATVVVARPDNVTCIAVERTQVRGQNMQSGRREGKARKQRGEETKKKEVCGRRISPCEAAREKQIPSALFHTHTHITLEIQVLHG